VIVASDENGNDILTQGPVMLTEENDIIERGNRCPDLCPPSSPLNT